MHRFYLRPSFLPIRNDAEISSVRCHHQESECWLPNPRHQVSLGERHHPDITYSCDTSRSGFVSEPRGVRSRTLHARGVCQATSLRLHAVWCWSQNLYWHAIRHDGAEGGPRCYAEELQIHIGRRWAHQILQNIPDPVAIERSAIANGAVGWLFLILIKILIIWTQILLCCVYSLFGLSSLSPLITLSLVFII